MIRVLEDSVINKIAAGEVVERPASVVKELVENALDAGTTDLRVELKQGGRSLIRVEDNGSGMGPQDATLCLERHATSKIRTDQDLFRVGTLGFRGEALPSIASVSRFELLTRPESQDAGTRVVVEGGRILDVRDAGCPRGTSIAVRNLFYNVPARRKFLRSPDTELAHCVEAVVREALIRPHLDVEITHDGEVVLRAAPVADRAARAGDVLGPHGRALVPVSVSKGNLEIEALVSPVGVHRGSAVGAMYLYVNGRFVKDPVLRRAVNEAYKGIVPKGRYPTVVLEVRIPPDHVDVNVHPAKTEVRFQFAMELEQAVATGIREALHRVGIQQPVANEARYRPKNDDGITSEQGALPLRAPPVERFAEPREPDEVEAPPAAERTPERTAERTPERTAERTPERPAPRPAPRFTYPEPADPPALLDEGPAAWAPPPPAPAPSPVVHVVPPFDDRATRDLLPVARFADLRVIGQLNRTYVLCEGGGELVIVDQHAAHERITLHRLKQAERERLGGGQRLLTPALIELSPARARALSPQVAVLQRVGLEVEPFGGNTFAIKQVPEALNTADLGRLLEDVADDVAEGGRGEPAQEFLDHLMATMACHTSVRAGQVLSPYEMRELLRALDEVDFSVCAHGRPVVIRVSGGELERRFHRA